MSTRTRLLIVLAVVALMVVAFAVPAFAAGKSVVGHESLYAKTPVEGGPWTIVPGGASGKMMFKLTATNTLSKFVFNGRGLVPGMSYSLVNHLGWPNVGILGIGVADEFGQVHIAGKYTTALVSDGDRLLNGRAKVWLIPTANLNGTVINVWDVPSMLFEGKGIKLNTLN